MNDPMPIHSYMCHQGCRAHSKEAEAVARIIAKSHFLQTNFKVYTSCIITEKCHIILWSQNEGIYRAGPRDVRQIQ